MIFRKFFQSCLRKETRQWTNVGIQNSYVRTVVGKRQH